MANKKLSTNLTGKLTLILATGLAVCFISGCQPPDMKPPKARTGLGLLAGADGKPIVRVLLTPAAVGSVDLSAGKDFRILADRMVRMTGKLGTSPVSTVKRSGGLWIVGNASFQAAGVTVEPIDNRNDRYVGFNGKTYRGKLHLLPKGPSGFIVINYVNFDDYLAGVLARELFGSWHIEAYRSLAVAARTFALHHMLHNKRSSEYDVDDTVSSQVYGGRAAETQKSRHAVDSTSGWALTVKYNGKNRIFMPQYSSCCGGWVNAAIVLRDAPPIAPLTGGQKDAHCTASKRYRWAPVQISKAELFSKMSRYHPSVAAMGGIATIRVTQRLTHGRPVWVDVVGVNGKSTRLRAEKIRLALIFGKSPAGKKLYSMNCQIVDVGSAIEFRNGRGFGHGVGMCQYGLQGKAMAGWKANQIINFYYPGADIVSIY
ncbi:MAG: SpoIID/LytB domain-containing protein [Phycisphaerae bacterium]|jgi:stage II sporulation protein D|nr:SpoIID/LytB domain-containing protein [Phycisphaerae bacterium]